MQYSTIIDFLLIFAKGFFEERKDDKALDYLAKILALKQANGDINAHMENVAKLMRGEAVDLDFGDLLDRINSEVDKLTAEPDPAEDEGQAPF